MKKWKNQDNGFEFDLENKKMRCISCHEFGANTDFAEFQDINFRKASERMKRHCNTKKHKDSVNGIEKKLKLPPAQEAADSLISALDKATSENMKQHEKHAYFLLQLTLFVADEAIAIRKIYKLR